MEYKYTLAHKDGRLHADADAFSRYPLAEWVGQRCDGQGVKGFESERGDTK